MVIVISGCCFLCFFVGGSLCSSCRGGLTPLFWQVGCDPFDTTGCDCAGNWQLETDLHEGP